MKSYYEEHVEDCAAALYDGGWRSTDKEEIKKEYNMDEKWATENIWTGTENPRKAQASEIIRDALQIYVEAMGKDNNNP